MSEKTENELAHGRRIAARPEFYWGWSGPAGRLRAARRAGMYRGGGLAAGGEALEIGCGTGIFTALAAGGGARITAIDICPELLEKARAACRAPGAGFRLMNAERLDFADASFDCVYGSSVLHHLDLAAVLPELLRVLRPGGRLVFTEPNMLNPQILLQKNLPPLKRLMGDSPDETAFFRWRIKGVLERAGFSGVTAEPFDFLHPWTPAPLVPLAERLGLLLEKLPLVKEIAGSLLIQAAKPPAAGRDKK